MYMFLTFLEPRGLGKSELVTPFEIALNLEESFTFSDPICTIHTDCAELSDSMPVNARSIVLQRVLDRN